LQLGLASNFDARLRRVVAGIPALRPIKHLVISSEVGWKKPASGFFAALAARIALPPAEILFVGDDLANDYYGARSAGLQPVLLARTAAATESPALVHSIRSLAGLLNLLPARDL
jgi:putative hydrolase of the HAD superfamily